MTSVRPWSAALVLLLGAACAHTPRTTAVDTPTEPELIGCTSYVPPVQSWHATNQVQVEVVVQPNGTVQPGATRHVPSRYDRGEANAVPRALQLVQSCTFAPAEMNGQAVRATKMMRMSFN